MRQVKFQLGEVLNFGLLKSNPGAVNQKGFLELVNLRPWATQLKYVDKVSPVAVVNQTQIFQTLFGVFSADRYGVYLWNGTQFVQQIALGLADGHVWSCADYGKFVVLRYNTTDVFICVNVESGEMEVTTTKPFDKDLPKSNALAKVGGQLVLGGLTSEFNSLDASYVAWSRIGSIDFSLSNDNESGFHCPQIGTVYDVQPFEKGFLAFGSTGVAKYTPAGVTFGFEKLWSVGTPGKGYAVGTTDAAWFVDIHGQLNQVTSKGVDVLDYAWILGGKDLFLFVSEPTNELWIQNSTGNFVVNPFGMYQVSVEVCGIFVDGGVLKAVVKTGTQTDAWFRTSKLDFNIGGLKTISEVYAQDSSTSAKYTEITVTRNGTDYVSRNFLENSEGVTHPGLTGNVMSVKRTTDNFASGEISNFHIQTVRVDGRSGLGFVGGQNQ